jgi:hypothetical protein
MYDAINSAASMPKVPLTQLHKLIAHRNLLAVDILGTPPSMEDLYHMKVEMLGNVNAMIRGLLAVDSF